MNVAALQQRLKAAGFDPGPADGSLGPQTYGALCGYTAGRQLGALGLNLGRGMHDRLPEAEITTGRRLSHFLGEGAHETEGFRYLVEFGGPTYCARYDGRAELGNNQPGDGYRFRGRGIFQLTGRANYAAMARSTGLDLVGNPDLAAQPAIAVWTACLYWTEHHLNPLADADDIEAVCRRINGGLNGLDERRRLTERAKTILLG